MKEFWNTIQLIFAAIGGWLGYFLGGCDGLLYALIAFVVIDYLTGIMCAISDHTLSSEVGFRGICRKVLIFLLVGIANVLDIHVLGNGSVLRSFSSTSPMRVCPCWRMPHTWVCPFPKRSRMCWSSSTAVRKEMSSDGIHEQPPGGLHQTQSQPLRATHPQY